VLTGNFPTVYILVQSLPIDLFITPYWMDRMRPIFIISVNKSTCSKI
jgi:hypothetical protein